MLIILTTYILISYYKHRYQPRLTTTSDGSVEISLRQMNFPSTNSVTNAHCLEDPCIPCSVVHQNRENTPEIDNTLLPQTLPPTKLSAKPASRSIPV